MTCANNCRGVDPNSVIIGGGAVLAASAVSGLSLFGVILFYRFLVLGIRVKQDVAEQSGEGEGLVVL